MFWFYLHPTFTFFLIVQYYPGLYCLPFHHSILAGMWKSNFITSPWSSKWSKSTCPTKIYLPKNWHFLLFLEENICCWYSLEAPHRGTSNEYPQHMFSLRNKISLRNKKNIYLIIWILFYQSCELLVPGQVNWNFLLVLREMGQVGHRAWYFHSSDFRYVIM